MNFQMNFERDSLVDGFGPSLLTVQKVFTSCVVRKRVVYKLHAGWFINRTLGELRIRGLCTECKKNFSMATQALTSSI